MGGAQSIAMSVPYSGKQFTVVAKRRYKPYHWIRHSLQALVHRLEHPNKLLHSIFDVLYEVELISEDAFIDWEESTEPGEQEGKGVALKSCTQFFQWLKTAEPEDDAEDQQKVEDATASAQPQKPVFSIGED